MRRIFLALTLYMCAAAASAQPVNAPPGGPVQCNAAASYSSSVAGTTQLVPVSAGERIYVCGWNIVAAAGATIQLTSGTGTNCGTGTAALTPVFALPAGVFSDSSPFNRGLITGPGLALCVVQTGAVAVQATVFYGQY